VNQLPQEVYDLIDAALAEDQTANDLTTSIMVSQEFRGNGLISAKAHGVLAGGQIAKEVFLRVDSSLEIQVLLPDGATLLPESKIARIAGSASSILRAERVALNFLQRMSGIASYTNRFVQAIIGYDVHIMDTRKTVPGHRYLDKHSVRMGGGQNHRMNLADGILIKDNHIKAVGSQGIGLKNAIEMVLSIIGPSVQLEIETETLEEVRQAADAGAHIIMLDNMPVSLMREAVVLVNSRALLEASGGITLQSVRAVAETGVNMISIGQLTHSPQALDISLEITLHAGGLPLSQK
jgi:nicotinate-nucleotide pyrophosphorylase (carboxylating)